MYVDSVNLHLSFLNSIFDNEARGILVFTRSSLLNVSLLLLLLLLLVFLLLVSFLFRLRKCSDSAFSLSGKRRNLFLVGA